MWVLAAFALAGGLAQFIDGTLGMGFGVTSATILLFLGISPVTASAATHAAKLPPPPARGPPPAPWPRAPQRPRPALPGPLPGDPQRRHARRQAPHHARQRTVALARGQR